METFAQMALRVAKDMWFAVIRQPISPTTSEIYSAPHSEQSIIDFATRIRDELAKGQEPVAYEEWSDEGQEWDLTRTQNSFAKQRPLYAHPAPIPADMVLVPREPTETMQSAFYR